MNAARFTLDESLIAFDVNAFRQALGCFPTGVAIVTTIDESGDPVGITCNSFSSVSLTPPLVLWSLRTASRSLQTYQNARGFAINVLSAHQQALSNRFASGTIQDKFEGVDHSVGESGLPLIDACVATFECKTVAQHTEGDHVIFVGQVEHFGHGQQFDPLVFCKGAYASLTESLRSVLKEGNIPATHIHEARAALHDAIVRLACRHGTEGDFAAIQANLDAQEARAAEGDFARRSETALEYFSLIAAAAHNEVLEALTNSLAQIMGQAMSAQTRSRYLPELIAARKHILECLRQRDPECASAALNQYLGQLQALKSELTHDNRPTYKANL